MAKLDNNDFARMHAKHALEGSRWSVIQDYFDDRQ